MRAAIGSSTTPHTATRNRCCCRISSFISPPERWRASAAKRMKSSSRRTPTLRHEITDPFGNPLIEIAIESAHNTLEIVARTNVETTAATPIEPLKTPAWETVRDALRYRAGWRPDPAILEATQFLFESPLRAG